MFQCATSIFLSHSLLYARMAININMLNLFKIAILALIVVSVFGTTTRQSQVILKRRNSSFTRAVPCVV